MGHSNIAWNTDISIPLNQTFSIEFNHLKLSITRLRYEWEIRYYYENGSSKLQIQNSETSTEATKRYLDASNNSVVKFLPANANRSIVVRPIETFRILGKETAILFVKSPIWLQIYTANQKLLIDLPTRILSETWFGNSMVEGELCYANDSFGTLDIENNIGIDGDIITPVYLMNKSQFSFLLERFSLPVNFLTLYLDEKKYLWTQAFRLTANTDDENFENYVLDKTPPKYAVSPILINKPRRQLEQGLWKKALTTLGSITNRHGS